MVQPSISYVDVRFVAHATEDINKGIEAVNNIFPSDFLNDVSFNRNVVEGHYGNPITFFETRINDKEIVKALVENIDALIQDWQLAKNAILEQLKQAEKQM